MLSVDELQQLRRNAADASARATFALFMAREMRRAAVEQRQAAAVMRARMRRATRPAPR